MQRNFARKAAAAARSQIADSARRAADYESESEVDLQLPTRKLARVSVTDRTRVRHNKQEPDWYIAVDFGTTFTTVAFYRRGTPIERIHTIDNFPGGKQHHQTHKQIPTEIWYPKKNTHPFGQVKQRDIRMRFGNEVHRMAEDDEGVDVRKIYDDDDRVTMMKLLLDQTEYAQPSKERLQETLESIKAKGHVKKFEDVFFHFFRAIFRASKTRLGSDFNENSLGMLQTHFESLR
jgi:molecular chaperone DnaK (HSP70)